MTRHKLRAASVLITGASSGLGAALARNLATPERCLTLGGRDPDRLRDVAAACAARGAHVNTRTVDVTQTGAMREWIESADRVSPLDLVVANAGVSAGTGDSHESEAQARRIFAVDLDGVLNTIHPAIDRMAIRGKGQIAIMASLAGFRGFPGAPAYSASKAAVKAYGEALRCDLRSRGLQVSVVCPGFVDTPMTKANRFRMPFLMSADRAAAVIVRGLSKNRGRIAFPWPTYGATWLIAALPCAVADRILCRMPTKSSGD